ncbi:MAG TPA: hypothetical protein VKL61_08970 [Candidatus Polarisedimenticolia bacterium]|nr:hypothetical protein [Candidatus Polarisedimenticolia bacterium]
MEEKFGKDQVVLLAVSTDGPDTRPRIPDFLKKYGIHARVFVAQREEIPFDLRFVGSLFLLDRKGFVGGVPSEFFASDRREILEKRIPDLLEGRRAPGPLLLSLEKAPPDFGILWQQPLDSSVRAVAIAPATPDGEAEIGVLDDQKLSRFTGSGQLKDYVNSNWGKTNILALYGVDLDGNGRNEWILVHRNGFNLMTSDGDMLGGYSRPGARVVGFRDLDGDGAKEILVQSGRAVVAKRALPGILWKTEEIENLRSARPDFADAAVVQTGDRICTVDRAGRLGRPLFRTPQGKTLIGTLRSGDGRTLDLFGGDFAEGRLDLAHDLNGDGQPEILLAQEGGMLAYGLDGSLRMLLRIVDSLQPVQFAAGNLDGRPGDELVLAIPQYGLVVLGRTSPPPAISSTGSRLGGPAAGEARR